MVHDDWDLAAKDIQECASCMKCGHSYTDKPRCGCTITWEDVL